MVTFPLKSPSVKRAPERTSVNVIARYAGSGATAETAGAAGAPGAAAAAPGATAPSGNACEAEVAGAGVPHAATMSTVAAIDQRERITRSLEVPDGGGSLPDVARLDDG